MLSVAGMANFDYAEQQIPRNFIVRAWGDQVRDSGYALPNWVALGKGPSETGASGIPRLLEPRKTSGGFRRANGPAFASSRVRGGTGESIETLAQG